MLIGKANQHKNLLGDWQSKFPIFFIRTETFNSNNNLL